MGLFDLVRRAITGRKDPEIPHRLCLTAEALEFINPFNNREDTPNGLLLTPPADGGQMATSATLDFLKSLDPQSPPVIVTAENLGAQFVCISNQCLVNLKNFLSNVTPNNTPFQSLTTHLSNPSLNDEVVKLFETGVLNSCTSDGQIARVAHVEETVPVTRAIAIDLQRKLAFFGIPSIRTYATDAVKIPGQNHIGQKAYIVEFPAAALHVIQSILDQSLAAKGPIQSNPGSIPQLPEAALKAIAHSILHFEAVSGQEFAPISKNSEGNTVISLPQNALNYVNQFLDISSQLTQQEITLSPSQTSQLNTCIESVRAESQQIIKNICNLLAAPSLNKDYSFTIVNKNTKDPELSLTSKSTISFPTHGNEALQDEIKKLISLCNINNNECKHQVFDGKTFIYLPPFATALLAKALNSLEPNPPGISARPGHAPPQPGG